MDAAMELALYQPDIAGNVGAMIRTAACLGVRVHIVEPCGFPFSMEAFRRTAMDYADHAKVTRHADWNAFLRWITDTNRRVVLMTTRGGSPLQNMAFNASDVLLMGSESAGVPESVHNAADAHIRISMASGLRSLNVGVAAGISLFEALRQIEELPT